MVSSQITQDDRNFLALVRRLGEAGIAELCDELDVTSNAVRQRVTRLEALGYVERKAVRHGRGRPHYMYSATDAGIRQLGDNYAELAMLLWRELNQIEDDSVREQVLSRVRSSLINLYRSRVTGGDVGSRIAQLQSGLSEQGFDVETIDDGQRSDLPILRENNCPYHEIGQWRSFDLRIGAVGV